MCASVGLADAATHGDYLRHLAALGVVIAPGVERTIGPARVSLGRDVSRIFNPRFINQHVYGLLANPDMRGQMGFVSYKDLEDQTPALDRDELGDLRDLLKDHLVAFEWRHDGRRGLLVPDLLPERWPPGTLAAAASSATLRFDGAFLGEPAFFEFLAGHKRSIRPLRPTAAERRMAVEPVGVFRNEVGLRQDNCDALVQVDVIEAVVHVAVAGPSSDEANAVRERLVGDFLRDVGPDAVSIERTPAFAPPRRPARRGRPPSSAEARRRDDRIYDGWLESGERNYGEYAARIGMDAEAVRKAVDRVRQRRSAE